MAGTSVRVIKGLRLRTPGDDKPTVEEKLEEDMRGTGGDSPGDNANDSQRDNLKPAQNKGTDLGDNHHQINKEEKNNPSNPEQNKPTETTGEEEKRNIATNNFNLTKVENKAVNSVTPKQINWQSYPYNSSNEKKLQERASKVKEIIWVWLF